MNSNSILTSNLLDIIFDNRNKEYGAYVLRRDYNKRLLKSLIGMFAVVTMFVVWQTQQSKPLPLEIKRMLIIPDQTIMPPPEFEKKIELIKKSMGQVKVATVPNEVPVIVADPLVKQSPPTNQQLLNTLPGEYKDGPPSDGPDNGPGDKAGTAYTEVKPVTPPEKKEVIISSPEIAAQYPGGIHEFIKFLKRNLRSPEDMEEGSITVKVKFIVSLNGELLGFNVVQTGGEIFDKEVIRVLKKMPKWVPGKSNGESVSSYYTLPVKFTAE